jgi:hypothetical protein
MSQYQRTTLRTYGAVAASTAVDNHVDLAVRSIDRQITLLEGALGGTDAGSAARASYMAAIRKLREAAGLAGTAVGHIQKAAEQLAAL